MQYILITSAILFIHTWLFYPLVLYVITRGKACRTMRVHTDIRNDGGLPPVSIVIPVHNAADKILSKLANTKALKYPVDLVEVIVVSDGSTDDTVSMVHSLAVNNVHLYSLTENMGKSVAQNEGVSQARHDIIIFTDVDSRLDPEYLMNLVPLFDDPAVACVGGTPVLVDNHGNIARSQGLYWRIEQFIRKSESCLGMLHSLPGWGFAIRKKDFVTLDPDTGDDMVLPLDMILKGKLNLLADNAIVIDSMPNSMSGEYRARKRITLRNFTAVMRRKSLLNPLLFPRVSFALWSHKILRWLSPCFLLAIFASSLYLSFFSPHTLYRYLLLLQFIFYAIGTLGFFFISRRPLPIVGVITSFLLANAGFLSGLFSYIRGTRIKHYSGRNQLI